MKFLTAASLLQFLLIFVAKSPQDVYVESAVGLYGPDRYEGVPETCLLPMEFGYCRAKIQRYYFDIRRMKCNMFYWGGCAGNDNNFKTMEECNDICSTGYDDTNTNSIVPLKRERSEKSANNDFNSSANTKTNALNSRGGSNVSKPTSAKSVKSSAQTLRDNSNSNGSGSSNGTAKASAKSFNVNPTTKQYKYPLTSDNFEDDEEYDE